MQVAAAADGPFELPDGWVVEVRPRGNASSQISDKYYHEPYTGRKFRSLASVKRYLNGEEEPTPRSKAEKIHQVWKSEEADASRKRKDVVSSSSKYQWSSILPDGWIEEHVPRKDGLRTDRYFIECGTGRKFRSLPEVQRYLTVKDRIRPKLKPMKLTYPMTNSAPRKEACPIKAKTTKTVNFSSFNPPEKVNWVLSCSEMEDWTPFVDESKTSSHAKEQWREAFFLGMTTNSPGDNG